MPSCKSQKRAEADKRIEEALDEHLHAPDKPIREVARDHEVSHSTLLRRLKGGNPLRHHANHNKSSQLRKKMQLQNGLLALQLLGIHQSMHLFMS